MRSLSLSTAFLLTGSWFIFSASCWSALRWQRWFLSGATVLVTLNYLLALVFIPLPGSFQAYLAIGALYWATSGFLGLRLLAALRDSEQVY